MQKYWKNNKWHLKIRQREGWCILPWSDPLGTFNVSLQQLFLGQMFMRLRVLILKLSYQSMSIFHWLPGKHITILNIVERKPRHFFSTIYNMSIIYYSKEYKIITDKKTWILIEEVETNKQKSSSERKSILPTSAIYSIYNIRYL